MTDIFISARRGAGAPAEILYGTVTFKPTLAHSRSTSIVLPAPTTFDLVDGEVVATNVQPTPAPVEGKIEWAYEVTFKDRHSKTYSFLVGVPDTTAQVNFTSLPRYFETKPPLFGQGPKGEPGESATVAVGTVTGGTTAQVTNSGTNTDAVLNFVLPKGDKGDTGAGVPAGGTALQYVRKNAGNTATEWVSATGALATASSAGFMSSTDKALLDGATFDSTPNTLIKRSASGRVNYPDPVSSQNPVTVNWLNSNIDNRVEGVLTASPDSLTKIQLDKMYLKKNEVIANVEDFGAVADNTSDNTQAFQDAMNYLKSEGGGLLYIPPGNYYISNQINLTSNILIYGFGATLIKKAGAPRYVVFAGSSGESKGYGSGPSNITCVGVTFKGQFGASNGRGVCAFALHHSQDILVYACKFTEASNGGHRFDLQGCRRITIRDNTFEGFDTSVPTTSYYNEDIQLDYSARLGLSFEEPSNNCFDGLGCEDIIVTGNRWLPLVKGSTVYPAGNPIGSHGGLESQAHRRIWFTDNYVGEGIADTSSFINGRIHMLSWNDVYIQNNVFLGGGNLISAIRMYATSRVLPLSEVSATGAANIDISPHYTCTRINIKGNIFEGFMSPTASNVAVIHCVAEVGNTPHRGLIIEGNTFRNNKYQGVAAPNDSQNLIEVTNGVGIRIASNTATLQRRLCIVKQSDSVSVADNTISESSNNVISVSDSTRVTISRNQLSGLTGSPAIILSGGSLGQIDNNSVYSGSPSIVAIRITGGTVRARAFGNSVVGVDVTLGKAIEISGASPLVAVVNNFYGDCVSGVTVEGNSTTSANTGNISI